MVIRVGRTHVRMHQQHHRDALMRPKVGFSEVPKVSDPEGPKKARRSKASVPEGHSRVKSDSMSVASQA